VRQLQILAERKNEPKREETTKAAMNAPSASLRSEDDEIKRAVEMTPRGKRGQLKKPKRVSHSFHRAWKSGEKRAGFPHSHRADGGFTQTNRRRKDGAEFEFQLTDPGHLKHHKDASVASLRM
jgi:hypothetical protein